MFGINKNGTKHKVGVIMPSFFPSSRVTYDGGTVEEALDDALCKTYVSYTPPADTTYSDALDTLWGMLDLTKIKPTSKFEMTNVDGSTMLCPLVRIDPSNVYSFIGFTEDDGTTYTDLNIFKMKQSGSDRSILRLYQSGVQRIARASVTTQNGMSFKVYY